jgi:signal transduction histidine kinase
VRVRAEAAGDGLLLTFLDNGKGFPGEPEALGKMFVRHTTRSGSGLGLYLAKLLAKRMNGSLSFHHGSPGFEARLRLSGRMA